MRLSCPALFVVCFSSALSAEQIPFAIVEAEAVAALEEIQAKSIADKTEYCGYIIWYHDQITHTHTSKGDHDSCLPPQPPSGAEIIASFHSHGNHDPEYHSEVPSDLDIQGDYEEGIYGFVGTPGGRVWLIDPFHDEIFLVCGEQCIPQDQSYNAGDYPPIPDTFSKEELIDFLEE